MEKEIKLTKQQKENLEKVKHKQGLRPPVNPLDFLLKNKKEQEIKNG